MTNNIQNQPLFIVGLQKSGTTLLNRLLSDQPYTIDPFKPEGRYFWGDNPPFSPSLPPCGRMYQAHNGKNGHYLSEADFVSADQDLLIHKIDQVKDGYKVLINKNPYNSVRIKWLKSIFPESRIIAIIRNPVSNIFSLKKKFIPHKHMGLPPEKGWWGVKPKNWESLVSDDLIEQLCNQWLHVNKVLLENAVLLNGLIDYRDLCINTLNTIQKILAPYKIRASKKSYQISHQDSEFKYGSRLLSKNKEYSSQGFQINLADEAIEIPAFTEAQVKKINNLCGATWDLMKNKFFLNE